MFSHLNESPLQYEKIVKPCNKGISSYKKTNNDEKGFIPILIVLIVLAVSTFYLFTRCSVTNFIDKHLHINLSKLCSTSQVKLSNNLNVNKPDTSGIQIKNGELFLDEFRLIDKAGNANFKSINGSEPLTIGNTTLYVNPSTGQVGVGTNAPLATFEVNGSVRFSNLAGEDARTVIVNPDGSLSSQPIVESTQTNFFDTDNQKLSINGHTLTITNGSSVVVPDNDGQTLSLSGTSLSISGGNTINISNGGTVTAVGSGNGLTGGTITGTGTLSIDTTSIASCTGSNQKILWDNTNYRFTCGTDNNSGGSGGSVVTNATLTGDGSVSTPLAINLANANTWTATQTFSAGISVSGGFTVSSGSVSLPAGSIINAALANSSLTVTAGTGLTGGGVIALGGSASVDIGEGTGINVAADSISVDLGDFTTDNLAQGSSNFYFSNTLARGAFSVTSPLTYNSGTGIFGITQATTSTNGYLSSTDWNTFNDKESVLSFSGGLTRIGNSITSDLGTSIDTSEITNGTILFADWASNSCSNGNIPKYNGSAWVCAADNDSGGTITGSGTATRLAFWNGSSSLSSSADLYWDNPTSRLGIGNTAPSYKLDINSGFSLRGVNIVNNQTVSESLYGVYATVSLDDMGNYDTANRQYGGYFYATGTGSMSNSYGVYGISDATNTDGGESIGVYGDGATVGVYGTGISSGVSGLSTAGAGVVGQSNTGTGIIGTVVSGIGGSFFSNGTSAISVYSSQFNASGYSILSEGGKNYFSGNVGIGDSTPASALTVGNGDLFQVNSSGAITASTAITTSGNLTVSNGLTSLSSSATTANVRGLSVAQTGAISGTGYAGHFSKTGASTTNVGLFATATGATNNYAALFENGNVGIGTTIPVQKLDIVGGAVRIDNDGSSSSTAGCIRFSGTELQYSNDCSSYNSFAAAGGWTDDGTTVRLSTASDNVGIGSTSAFGSKLYVLGNTTLAGDIATNTHGVNGLQDSGSIIPNSSFEVDNNSDSTPDNWTFGTTGVVAASLDNTTSAQGTNDVLFSASSTLGSGSATSTSTCFPITGGQTYNLYAQAAAPVSASSLTLTLRVKTYTTKANCTASTSNTNYSSFSSAIANTGYQAKGGTVSPAATQKWARAEIQVDASAPDNEGIYVDSFRMTPSSLTTGTDIAENYLLDPNNPVEPGDIVSVKTVGNDYFATKTIIERDPKMFGIVTTKPAMTLDDGSTQEKTAIALNGRVPLKVTSKNGSIKAGDYITSSTIDGYGAKAVQAGSTVAKALQDFDTNSCTPIASVDTIAWPYDDGNNPSKPCFVLPDGTFVGKIMAFVNVSWYDPQVYLTETGDMSIIANTQAAQTEYSLVNNSDMSIVERIGLFGKSLIGNLKAGSIEAKDLTLGGLNLNNTLATQSALLSSQGNKISSMSANLETIMNDFSVSVSSVSADLAGLKIHDETFSNQIAQLKSDIESLRGEVQGASTASSSATLVESDREATISGLTVIGKSNLYDVGITGTITAGLLTVDGVTGEINTLSEALKIQSLSLGSVEIMGAKLTIDQKGNIEMKDGHIKGNDTFRGKAMLKAGESQIRVNQTWEETPFSINVTSTYNTKVWVENIDATGFTIKVDTTNSVDKELFWMALW